MAEQDRPRPAARVVGARRRPLAGDLAPAGATLDTDPDVRGAYLDAVVYASRPCNQRSYCRDECECVIAAGIAAAANASTASYLDLHRHGLARDGDGGAPRPAHPHCCGDSGDCADADCGRAGHGA